MQATERSEPNCSNKKNGKWVPVAFYSRKLAGSQRNWSTREKETYAIVASLRKWAGTIGFQPVVILTDHRSLEEWVTEHVDTPSGPRGRKARWHETLSQFELEIKYIPGKENIVADALSRWAYPASSAREDVSFHGSAAACEEIKKMVERELEERKMVAVFKAEPGAEKIPVLMLGGVGVVDPENTPASSTLVVTRGGRDTSSDHPSPRMPDTQVGGGEPRRRGKTGGGSRPEGGGAPPRPRRGGGGGGGGGAAPGREGAGGGGGGQGGGRPLRADIPALDAGAGGGPAGPAGPVAGEGPGAQTPGRPGVCPPTVPPPPPSHSSGRGRGVSGIQEPPRHVHLEEDQAGPMDTEKSGGTGGEGGRDSTPAEYPPFGISVFAAPAERSHPRTNFG